MANHVKNKLSFIGDEEEISKLIDEISTFHPSEPRLDVRDYVIFKHKEEDNNYGYLNRETQDFEIRQKVNVSIHEVNVKENPDILLDYEMLVTEDYTQFPDFNKILPQPDNIFNGNLGREEEEMCKREGRPTWYEWNTENWGTKWNSYSCRKDDDGYYFKTAWRNVPTLISKLSEKYPSLIIKYDMCEESAGYNCGSIFFKGGSIMKEIYYGDETYEAYEHTFKLDPNEREYYKLTENGYEYSYKYD